MNLRFLAICLCLVPSGAAPVRAEKAGGENYIQRQGPATLEAAAPWREGAVDMGLADSLQLAVEIVGGKDLEVSLPTPIVNSPQWKVRRQAGPASSADDEKDRVRLRYLFLLDPMKPGDLPLALAPWRYRENDGRWQTVVWQPIPVRVASEIVRPEVKDLRGQPDIEELSPSSSLLPWIWGLAGLAPLSILAAWAGWRRRHARGSRARSPEAWALLELARLERLPFAERQADRFLHLLTGVLRRYLERRFQMPALRQTTPEFVQALDQAEHLAQEQRDFLRRFLERCDLVKFAQAPLTRDESRELIEAVRDFAQKHVG